jgi:hypothetical protein
MSETAKTATSPQKSPTFRERLEAVVTYAREQLLKSRSPDQAKALWDGYQRALARGKFG